MPLLLALFACLRYDGLDPSVPTVQDEARVECEATADAEYQRANGAWRPYFTRTQTYDPWGQLAHDRVEESESGLVREITEVWRGPWLDARDETDGIAEPPTSESIRQTWDGVFLERRTVDVDGQRTAYAFESAGINPYDRAEVDTDRDGVADEIHTFTWDGEHLIGTAFDRDVDGTPDATRTLDYDAEGRVILDDFVQGTDRVTRTWVWGGPFDNPELYQEVRASGDTVSTYRVEIAWTPDWRAGSYVHREDDTLVELSEETLDDAGRVLTFDRTFPDQPITPVRETWSWLCP